MKTTICTKFHRCIILGFLLFCLVISGCNIFLEVNSGNDRLLSSDVFDNESTANSAIADLYQTYKSGFITPSASLSILCGLSSDELSLVTSSGNNYQNNSLLPSDALPWSAFWQIINRANIAIHALHDGNGLAEGSKDVFTGEAKFWRAFSYFYLVNLFGDVPLILNPDVNQSAMAARQPVQLVYEQIMGDLLDAEKLLPQVNDFATGQKIRANKIACQALLARIYLFNKDWANALKYSSLVIGSLGYSLDPAFGVFKKSSNEAILQVANNSTQNIGEADAFLGTPPQMAAGTSLIASFEAGDLRKQTWLKSVTVNATIYLVPYKYPSNAISPAEYYMLLRLGEQYLIRAEAYAMQNKFTEAINDVNTLRSQHGGLNTPLSVPTDQTSAIEIILRERRVELFTELGHRWLDLKRLDKVDAVITAEKPGKWQTTDALYPLPTSDLLRNINLKQNPGYE